MALGDLLGAKIPLYAFNRGNKFRNGGRSSAGESKEPPVDFLDSLIIGEVFTSSYPLSAPSSGHNIRLTYSCKKACGSAEMLGGFYHAFEKMVVNLDQI